MTIVNRDEALAGWLDAYSPALDAERQMQLLAVVEARLDAATRPVWLPASGRAMALFAGGAAFAVLIGIWAGGGVVQNFGGTLAMAGLLLGPGG